MSKLEFCYICFVLFCTPKQTCGPFPFPNPSSVLYSEARAIFVNFIHLHDRYLFTVSVFLIRTTSVTSETYTRIGFQNRITVDINENFCFISFAIQYLVTGSQFYLGRDHNVKVF